MLDNRQEQRQRASELHRLGYRVPEDVSVIGYGDFAAATQISPMLTTLRLPGGDMGVAAFRLLIERMQSERRQLPPRRQPRSCWTGR